MYDKTQTSFNNNNNDDVAGYDCGGDDDGVNVSADDGDDYHNGV